MTWRDLRPWPDDWCEPERPYVTESGGPGRGGEVTLTFSDAQSRQWFAEWLRSKAGWTAFTAWVDERRWGRMGILWALDLDRDGLPVLAHRIIRELDDGTRVTACGRNMNAHTHPSGWWTTEPGVLPLTSGHIHCGETVKAA